MSPLAQILFAWAIILSVVGEALGAFVLALLATLVAVGASAGIGISDE